MEADTAVLPHETPVDTSLPGYPAGTLHVGDCRETLRQYPENHFTACVTDPPYDLTNRVPDVMKCGACGRVCGSETHAGDSCPRCGGELHRQRSKSGGFMGKDWDSTGVAFDPATWREVLRVMRPGGYLLAFGGDRTHHRLMSAIEDAGFEIRTCIYWCFGSGFPKSLDVSKAIDRAAGVEREVVGVGTRHGGGVNNGYDYGGGKQTMGNAVVPPVTAPATDAAKQWQVYGTSLKPAVEIVVVARKPLTGTVAENVQRWGCGCLNIDGCRVPATDGVPTFTHRAEASVNCYGDGKNGSNRTGVIDTTTGRFPANLIHDGSPQVVGLFPHSVSGALTPEMDVQPSTGWSGGSRADRVKSVFEANSGSAARFFYCAKASRRERGKGNVHPTVKPLALMRYLLTLVTMPGENLILDPFAGSGSTLIACRQLDLPSVGCELSAEYAAIIRQRINDPVILNDRPEPDEPRESEESVRKQRTFF